MERQQQPVKKLWRKELLPISQLWEQLSTALFMCPAFNLCDNLKAKEGVNGGRCEGDCMETWHFKVILCNGLHAGCCLLETIGCLIISN